MFDSSNHQIIHVFIFPQYNLYLAFEVSIHKYKPTCLFLLFAYKVLYVKLSSKALNILIQYYTHHTYRKFMKYHFNVMTS